MQEIYIALLKSKFVCLKAEINVLIQKQFILFPKSKKENSASLIKKADTQIFKAISISEDNCD